MKKVPPAHVRENLEARIAGHIMAVHRDYPDFNVSDVQVFEREQYKNGTKYTVVMVKITERTPDIPPIPFG